MLLIVMMLRDVEQHSFKVWITIVAIVGIVAFIIISSKAIIKYFPVTRMAIVFDLQNEVTHRLNYF